MGLGLRDLWQFERADYPYLEHDDVLAAIEYAAAAVNEREVPVARPV